MSLEHCENCGERWVVHGPTCQPKKTSPVGTETAPTATTGQVSKKYLEATAYLCTVGTLKMQQRNMAEKRNDWREAMILHAEYLAVKLAVEYLEKGK